MWVGSCHKPPPAENPVCSRMGSEFFNHASAFGFCPTHTLLVCGLVLGAQHTGSLRRRCCFTIAPILSQKKKKRFTDKHDNVSSVSARVRVALPCSQLAQTFPHHVSAWCPLCRALCPVQVFCIPEQIKIKKKKTDEISADSTRHAPLVSAMHVRCTCDARAMHDSRVIPRS